MTADHLTGALAAGGAGRGPVAVLVCENGFLAEESAARLAETGVKEIIALGPGAAGLSDRPGLRRAPDPIARPERRTEALNRVIRWAAGRWLLVAFNGEFLFYPFCETRSVADFTDFLTFERRRAATAYAVDLYSDALTAGDAAFSPREAWFDAAGWYGFEREGAIAEVFGGVGWRYEEFTPRHMLRVNRPALFLADPARPIRDDLWFGDAEYDSLSCPWHANPTLALMSARRAAALGAHPNFRGAVGSLMWPMSTRFEWRSSQLIEHGMMEAGQWL